MAFINICTPIMSRRLADVNVVMNWPNWNGERPTGVENALKIVSLILVIAQNAKRKLIEAMTGKKSKEI